MMPFRYRTMERKEQLLELLDPEHEVELDATFLKPPGSRHPSKQPQRAPASAR
jgi:hypothetical protein